MFNADRFIAYLAEKAGMPGELAEIVGVSNPDDPQHAAALEAALLASGKPYALSLLQDASHIVGISNDLRELLPVVFCGSGSDEAVRAAERIWRMLDDAELRRAYCLGAYTQLGDNLHPRPYSRILAWTYASGKTGSLLSGLPYREIAAMFEAAVPEHLMRPDELSVLRSLPDTITVYRGSWRKETLGEIKYGMSWTLDPNVAAVFAYHLGDPDAVLLQATVNKRDVLAYFGDNDGIALKEHEAEIVLRSGRVRNVKRLDCDLAAMAAAAKVEAEAHNRDLLAEWKATQARAVARSAVDEVQRTA